MSVVKSVDISTSKMIQYVKSSYGNNSDYDFDKYLTGGQETEIDCIIAELEDNITECLNLDEYRNIYMHVENACEEIVLIFQIDHDEKDDSSKSSDDSD